MSLDPSPSSTRLIVDADAAPFKEDMLALSAAAGIGVIFVCSPRHEMPAAPNLKVVHVDHRQPDAADFEVVNRSRSGDIVVTQDAGLAAMLLPRGVRVLSTRGHWFGPDSVDRALDRRHEIRKIRRRGKVPKARTSPFTETDRRRFRGALAQALGLSAPETPAP